MSEKPDTPLPRNPETHARHRQEAFWQITVPLIVGATLLFALIVLVILSEAGYISRWADIALIWVLPCPMLIALLIAGALGGLVYGMWKLSRWLPSFAFKVQNILTLVQAKVRMIANAIVEPVLRTRAFFAGAEALKHKLVERKLDRKEPNHD